MNRLYLSDLDGTLLLPDRTLGDRSRRVINRFVELGGRFTVATGRAGPSTAALLTGLRLPLPAIVNNGALTLDLESGVISRVRAMTRDAAMKVYGLALSLNVTPVAYALDQEDRTVLFHGPRPNRVTASYLHSVADHQPLHSDEVGSFSRREVRCLSFILLDLPSRLELLFSKLAALPGLTTHLGRSAYVNGIGVGEVQADDADKASAAEALARLEGKTSRMAVAFGDNCNDLPLLKWAGDAYCPPEAAAEVLAAVRGRIAPCSEQGVATFLEQIMRDMAPPPPL